MAFFRFRAAPHPRATALPLGACLIPLFAAAQSLAHAQLAGGEPIWLAPQIVTGQSENATLGLTVATADVNGDGYDDVVTSKYIYSGGSGSASGSVVVVYYGSADGPQLPGQEIVNPLGANTFSYFGERVASVGDVNGDGYADVMVNDERGGSSDPNTFFYRGTAYLYLGSAQGLESTPAATLVGDDVDGGAFGSRMASAGDVNGDGYDDVLVTENSHNPQQDECVFVYYGSTTGLHENTRTRLTMHTQTAIYGSGAASAGDVNGDGYDDVVIGAPGYGTSGRGAAFIYAGSAQGVATTPMTTLSGDQPGGSFGYAAIGVGDMNGDGYDDVMISSDCEATASVSCEFLSFPGAAWVFDGGQNGVSTQARAKFTKLSDDGTAANFGWQLERAGDVNGDGVPDVAISAAAYNGAGAVLVYLGPLTSTSQPAYTLSEADAGGFYAFGFAMGDVNGDGRRDPVVGAAFYSSPTVPGDGAVFVYRSRISDEIFKNGFEPD